MLVKVGSLVLNLDSLLYIDLFFTHEYEECEVGVEIAFVNARRYFWGEEAELLRWYFNHPTSNVRDIKDFR